MNTALKVGAVGEVLVLVSLFAGVSGCSQVPHSYNYQNLSPGADRAESWARSDQDKRNEGKYASTARVIKNLKIRTMYSDCFRLTEGHAQYGLLEPELVIKGEAVHTKGLEAYVLVAPLLRDLRDYPTPVAMKGSEVYRLDKDAPFALSASRMMEAVVGNPKFCVRFGAIDSKKRNGLQRNLIAVSVIPVGKSREPRKRPVARQRPGKPATKTEVQ